MDHTGNNLGETKRAGRFVLTLPLRTTPRDRSILNTRLEQSRLAYNALLGECLKRLRLMRESRAWRVAGKMAKGKERTAAYRELNKRFGFREYDLYPFIQKIRRHLGIGQHVDSRTMMSLAARAFQTAERKLFKGVRAFFKRRGEFRSVDGRAPREGICWIEEARTVRWGKSLTLSAIIDDYDPVTTHGLRHRVCYTRIVRMVIKGREHFYAQLVCEGEPYRKPRHTIGGGVVGLDIGPSTIAVVSDKAATLETFCIELQDRHQKIGKLQRGESRKRYANNPENFLPGGKTIRKGARHWRTSNRQRRLANERTELQRRESAHRKNLHGRLVHRVLSRGNDVRTEKLSYLSFQRNFGKSVKFRGPGLFVSRLKTVADQAGALVTEFKTRSTMLSQTCPKCGTLRKKKLSDRWHECACGCSGQRDLISAMLARSVVNDRLDARQSRKDWRRLCNVLRAASNGTNGTTGEASARVHPAAVRGRVPSHADARCNPVSVPDVVAGRKVQARAGKKPGENGPWAMLFSINDMPERGKRGIAAPAGARAVEGATK